MVEDYKSVQSFHYLFLGVRVAQCCPNKHCVLCYVQYVKYLQHTSEVVLLLQI